MKQSKIEVLKRLHKRVVHTTYCTYEDYMLEDKEISKLKGNYLLQMICPECFPIQDGIEVYPSRDTSNDGVRQNYPKLKSIEDQ